MTVITILLALALILIPFGLPGLWIMAALMVLGAVLGEVALWIALLSLALAAAAELAEWLIVRSMNLRYGGSPRAFWSAIAGGFVGLLVGAPLPIVGSLVGGFVGSFLGAALVSFYELQDVQAAGRVGWGVVLARTLSVGVKVAAGVVVLVLGGAAWVAA